MLEYCKTGCWEQFQEHDHVIVGRCGYTAATAAEMWMLITDSMLVHFELPV